MSPSFNVSIFSLCFWFTPPLRIMMPWLFLCILLVSSPSESVPSSSDYSFVFFLSFQRPLHPLTSFHVSLHRNSIRILLDFQPPPLSIFDLTYLSFLHWDYFWSHIFPLLLLVSSMYLLCPIHFLWKSPGIIRLTSPLLHDESSLVDS